MNRLFPAWSYHLVRLVLALVFLLAAALKLLDLGAFVRAVGDFGLVPDALVPATAVGVVAAELLVGLGLLADVRGALSAATLLLGLLLGVVVYGIALGLDIECGCFGPADFPGLGDGLPQSAVRNVGLLACCGYLYGSRLSRATHPATIWERIRFGGRFKREETHD